MILVVSYTYWKVFHDSIPKRLSQSYDEEYLPRSGAYQKSVWEWLFSSLVPHLHTR